MAKTPAERQADYRARQLAKKTEQGHDMAHLNLIISAAHRVLLQQAAARYGVTQAEMLARIIESSPLVKKLEADKDDFLSGRFSGGDYSDTSE